MCQICVIQYLLFFSSLILVFHAIGIVCAVGNRPCPGPSWAQKNALARLRGTTWSSLLASTVTNGMRSTRSPGWPRSRRTSHRGNVKVGERKQHKLDQEAKKASMNALRHKKQAANKEQKAWLIERLVYL